VSRLTLPCACGLFNCRFGPDQKDDRSARCTGFRSGCEGKKPQKGAGGGGWEQSKLPGPTSWSGPCTLSSLCERGAPSLGSRYSAASDSAAPRLGRSVPHVLFIRKHVAKLSLGRLLVVTESGLPHIAPSVSFHSRHSV